MEIGFRRPMEIESTMKNDSHDATEAPLARVLNNRRPLPPLPADLTPRLRRLDGVAAVLLDVYGTLVVSGSGDVGTIQTTEPSPAPQKAGTDRIQQAGAAIGLSEPKSLPEPKSSPKPKSLPTTDQLRELITATNDACRSPENPKPEVEILDVWRVLLTRSGRDDLAEQPGQVAALAAEYESRSNPTWPMPGALDALGHLADRGLRLGIVSNAQVFTIPLVEDLLGAPLARVFDLNLCFFSNRFRAAKPGPRLFDHAKTRLARLGVLPEQTVYIGNDMLNDVWAARQAGFRTVLFAGDARSLRLRRDHPDCAALFADAVLTDWNQIVECLG